MSSKLKDLLNNLAQNAEESGDDDDFNYRVAVGIIADNPVVFDEEDKKVFIKAWFKSPRALEVLDPEANDLKCGVGSKPGIVCKKEDCLLDLLCVHKDIPALPPEKKEEPVKEEKKEVKKIRASAGNLKVKA